MKRFMKRSGSLALAMLVSLSALLTVAAGALAVAARTYSASAVYQNGLASVYAAESGANWGLAYLKTGADEGRSLSFSSGGLTVVVEVDVSGASALVRSSARDSRGQNTRFLTLTCTRTVSDEAAVVTVKDISTNPF